MDWRSSPAEENCLSPRTNDDRPDQVAVPEAQPCDAAQQQIVQKPNRRRGRPWKCKVSTVWSIVCAMNLGLFSESSLKDVSFVNLLDVFMKNRYSAEEADLDGSDCEEAEPKLNATDSNTSAALWPFMQAVHDTTALKKSVRKRGKRKRSRWTIKRQKKRGEPAVPSSMVARRKLLDAANPKPAMKRRIVTAASSVSSLADGPAAGDLSGYNVSFKALHSRLSGYEARDPLLSSSAHRTIGEVRGQPPREVGNATRHSAPRYAEARARSSYDAQEPKRRRRTETNLPKRADYYKNVARVNDDIGDIWEDTTSSSDENEEDDNGDGDEEATLAERRGSSSKETDIANGNVASSREPASSCGRRTARRRRNREHLLKNRKDRSMLLRNCGKMKKKRLQRHRRAPAVDDRGVSQVVVVRRKRQRNLGRRVAPRPDLARRARKRCNHCDNPRRRSYNSAASCTCKGSLKDTATAIMRDIRAHIHNANANGHSAEEQAEAAECPNGNRAELESSGRDVSMKYEWEDEDTEDNSQSVHSSQSSTKAKTYGNPDRKPRRKRRWHKAPIDCKFVDRTETTYQSVLPEPVDLDSRPSTPSLKINVDDVNWGSEDSDVGSTLHPVLDNSSEGYEADGALDVFTTTADKAVVASDNCENDVARQERNSLMASSCYVYSEKPNDTVDTAAAAGERAARKTKFADRRDVTKDVITYGKRNKSSGKSSDCGLGQEKSQDAAKVKAKSADDSSKNIDSDNENEKKYGLRRRSTRSSINPVKESNVGKLIWGNCSGWWPALIIEADEVGMASEPGKLWVYWIGESQISLLNEKTQIEPFSRKLEERLAQKFRKNNTRSQAIDETIKMLRQRYECTLTKPYYYWIRRNIKPEELDNLCFYPYPTKMQERLDALKQKNSKATEQYILQQRSGSPEPKKPAVEKIKDTKAVKQMEDERLPLREQIPGIITWAKISGHNWWPAMIIDYRDCCLKEPGFGCQWIMWYGDYTVSQVHHLAFLKFHKGIEKMREYVENTKKHVYLMGVLQASKDYCSRLGCNTDSWSLDNVFKHFSDMTNMHVPYNHLQVSESNKVYDKYSNEIIKKINELKSNPNVDSQRKDDIKESDALRRVMQEHSKLNKLCLKCLKFPKDTMEAHPFFEGSLCKECSNLFKPCMFVFGNDDKCFYCTVCAATGTVFICDREDCPRVYCTACLKYLLCPEVYEDMLLEDPWECFLCRDTSRLPAKGLLRPRADWKEKFHGMFCTSSNPASNKMNVVNSNGEMRGIRVLSLFDGLSTGLVVLLKLGIIVDVYYASEIDQDSLTISSAHFGDRITYLGDVRGVTKEKVKEIMPIDLLIGGSPCNDLSLVNPARLGLHNPKGTGILFFEYIRILKQLKKSNKGHHLFWLYENVASMPSEFRLEMNKHLGQEPMVIDSADFSPQHRLRLYWHNLPDNPYFPKFENQQNVQDILTPNCNRYALVKKIRTVTTRTNSLRQGKAELKPIMMKGTSDTLWITELEEIFGFPRHYTDVKNLSATNRQRLIGKSWSVQTLTAILRPLCSFFKCNEDEKSPPLD